MGLGKCRAQNPKQAARRLWPQVFRTLLEQSARWPKNGPRQVNAGLHLGVSTTAMGTALEI